MSESNWTKCVSTRLYDKEVSEVWLHAKLDGVTPSKWIAGLIRAELQRRRAVASGGDDA